jgi:hypothetical protein
MPCDGCPKAPALRYALGWRVRGWRAISAARAAGTARTARSAGDRDRPAVRSQSERRRPSGAMCKVDTSARSAGPDARRPGRGATGATGTANAAQAPAIVRPADDAVREKIRFLASPRDRLADRAAVRLTMPARASGVPFPPRGAQQGAQQGARRDARRSVRGAHCRTIRKGQGADFPADGTGVQRIGGIAPLSLCERPTRAQDLLTTTYSELSYTQSNIFGFVMT